MQARTEPELLCRPGQLMAVAAHRSRRLSVIGQPNTRAAAVLGWFALLAMWGVHMLVAAPAAGQIQTLGSASAALEGRSKPRRRPVLMLVGLAGYLMHVSALAVPAAIEAVDLSALPAWLVMSHLLFGANFLTVVIVELFARFRRWVYLSEGRAGALQARRDELGRTGAPAYLAVGLVAGRRGKRDGERLFRALQEQLRADHAVAVLYPADEGLVQLYKSWGARLDDGAQRRMLLDYR